MSEPLDDARLQRWFDGALPAAEAAEVARRVANDDAWREAHERLVTARELLRARVDAEVDDADFTSLWERIDAELPAPAPRPALSERLRAWWAAHWTPVLVSAAAAAAVAFFVVRAIGPGGEEGPTGNGQVAVQGVQNDGNKTVLISQPAEDDEGSTVIWLLDEEQDEGAAAPQGEDPI